MSFIPNVLKKREAKDRQHRANFRAYLTARIAGYQARLDHEEFEDEDEAVHLTDHIQRLLRVIEELDKANAQGQGQQTAAM